MAKHLHFITKPIEQFINSQLIVNKISRQTIKYSSGQWVLDPITHIAHIKGEALFNQVFFNVVEKKGFKDPESQWKIYEKLVMDRQYIIEICKHSNLLDAFKIDKEIKFESSEYGEINFTSLCIILWDMHCKNEAKLCKQIIQSFFEHYIPQIFPNSIKKQLTQEELIKDISKNLYQKWNIKPDIKESFKITEDVVTFSLIAKTTEFHPVTLLTLEGKRLKPIRKKCYKTLHNMLKNNIATIPNLNPKVAKKSAKIKPLNQTN